MGKGHAKTLKVVVVFVVVAVSKKMVPKELLHSTLFNTAPKVKKLAGRQTSSNAMSMCSIIR